MLHSCDIGRCLAPVYRREGFCPAPRWIWSGPASSQSRLTNEGFMLVETPVCLVAHRPRGELFLSSC